MSWSQEEKTSSLCSLINPLQQTTKSRHRTPRRQGPGIEEGEKNQQQQQQKRRERERNKKKKRESLIVSFFLFFLVVCTFTSKTRKSPKLLQTHSVPICHVSRESHLAFYTFSFQRQMKGKTYIFLSESRRERNVGKGKVNKRRKDNVEMIRARQGKSIAEEKKYSRLSSPRESARHHSVWRRGQGNN